jgi:SAM-dependent methyltransferase
MASPLTNYVFDLLRTAAQEEPSPARLEQHLRALAKWRSTLIQNTMVQKNGATIMAGVFAGMKYHRSSSEGCYVPKLLGCYEAPLQLAVEEVIARGYRRVLNIGCAEGYYAVGLARRMPDAHIIAFDLNEQARAACGQLAEENGVSDRVTIASEFTCADFQRFADHSTLVLCDIEGAEHALLDPGKAPALARLDVIVEVHDCFHPGLSEEIAGRFRPTHEVTVIRDGGNRRPEKLPVWLYELSELDRLIAIWEWRAGPTPWLVMRHR